jgi:hypothetical protein
MAEPEIVAAVADFFTQFFAELTGRWMPCFEAAEGMA